MANNMMQKGGKGGGKGNPKMPKIFGANLASHIMTAVLIFALIIVAYNFVASDTKEVKNVSISELAKDVMSGTVTKIEVSGQNLIATLKDGSQISSKKETESSLTDTFSKYGVTPAELSLADITVKNESGFWYVVLNLLPILIPILFIIFFFYLTYMVCYQQ